MDTDLINSKITKFESKYNSNRMNEDTITAIMMIEKNLPTLKNEVENESVFKRRDLIVGILKKEFPKMNVEIVKNTLRSNKVYSPFIISLFMHFVCLIGNVLFGLALSTIIPFTSGIVIFCALINVMLIVLVIMYVDIKSY